MYSAIIGFAGSVYVYKVFGRLSNSQVAARRSVSSKQFTANTKVLLVMFGISQLLVAGAYSVGGVLVNRPEVAVPLAGIGTAAGITNLCSHH